MHFNETPSMFGVMKAQHTDVLCVGFLKQFSWKYSIDVIWWQYDFRVSLSLSLSLFLSLSQYIYIYIYGTYNRMEINL